MWTRFLFGAVLCMGSLVSAAPSVQAGSNVCILDRNPAATSPGISQCPTIEPFPGQGGFMADLDGPGPGAPEFRATRYRIADQHNYEISAGVQKRQLFNGAYFDPIPMAGVRLNHGSDAWTPIDAHGACRYVQNNSNKDIFVPFKTAQEWESFWSQGEAGQLYGGAVSVVRCSLPCDGTCDGNGYFFGPTSVDFSEEDQDISEPGNDSSNFFPTQLPYAKAGDVWPKTNVDHTFRYKCYEVKSESTGVCIEEGYLNAFGLCAPKASVLTPLQVTCCLEYGSNCKTYWHEWKEVWRINQVTAGVSADGLGAREEGWPKLGATTLFSHQVNNEKRPAQCNLGRDLEQVGPRCENKVADPTFQDKKKKKKAAKTPPKPGHGGCRY